MRYVLNMKILFLGWVMLHVSNTLTRSIRAKNDQTHMKNDVERARTQDPEAADTVIMN